ncbi:uncharacterized protein RHOBADRAFT_52810 [Rhodotorula graminis WP1]|uniref:F-box domain-containing protein n=1 Tax=Rhodotorula graminis (strain WP1) TaxID=578459 RepID=A0A194S5C0_RHOGW|nr:uncharacterized protein RHOBADRAFT_52810 [Rhodotorula graminis WP1]KPV75782.1 hypothetical protein RHOBADRAFT_52810 [Rhodotorula graminis WP1]
MTDTAARTTTSLLSFPPEVLVIILGHLDFGSLARFLVVSRTCHALFKAHPHHISRAISIHQGLADPRTSSAAAALDHRSTFPTRTLDDHLDPRELARVVHSQRWIGITSIPTWLDYAKRAHVIHRNWRTGTATSRLVTLDWAARPAVAGALGAPFWRFKVDVDAAYLVVSGLDGGYLAFRAQDGQLAWWSLLPRGPYPHVELSEGFLVQQLSSRTYLASCRTDLLPADHLVDDAFSSTAVPRDGSTPALGYVPSHAVTTSFPCFASKLRVPKLVATSADGQQLHVWDLVARTIDTLDVPAFAADVSNDARAYYVELDDECVYVAGQHAVLVVRPPGWGGRGGGEGERERDDDEPEYRTWPPRAPASLSAHTAPGGGAWYAFGCDGVGWEAVHHAGRHLVAIGRRAGDTDEAKLVWTCDKRAVWNDEGEDEEDEVERKTVVLVIEGADPVQLAVENDRAVFVTHDDELGAALWLINLRAFVDWEDFAADPPQPICLAYPLPTLGPPSRVEMTSTEIFVPTVAAFFPPSTTSPLEPAPEPSSSDHDHDHDHDPTAAEPAAAPPTSRLARAFTAMQRAVPPGRTPLSFHWEPLSRTSRTPPVGPPSLLLDEDVRVPGGSFARLEREDDDLVGRLREAWEGVQQAAREDGIEGHGGSDAFAVWDFAPKG